MSKTVSHIDMLKEAWGDVSKENQVRQTYTKKPPSRR